MRVVRPVFFFVAAVGFAAGSAQAQSCRGYSSLETAKMNVGGNAWFTDGATQFGGQLNMRRAAMGLNNTIGLGAGVITYDGTGAESSTDIHGSLGFEKKTSAGIEWCPELMVGYQMNAGGAKDATNLDLGVGLGIGKAMGKMGGFEMVPFGGVAFVRSAFSIEVAGTTFDESETNFVLGAGLGMRLASGIQLSPQLSKSSHEDAKVMYGLTVSFPFGK